MDITKEVVQAEAIIFYPSRPTSKEWAKTLGAVPGAVALEGAAAAGKVGPQIGRYDIYSNDSTYMFCMSLPGVDLNGDAFSCEVKPLGEIIIRGETTTGSPIGSQCFPIIRTVAKSLPDSGSFTVAFQLPGPVQTRTLVIYSHGDGILWGVVDKQKGDTAAANWSS